MPRQYAGEPTATTRIVASLPCILALLLSGPSGSDALGGSDISPFSQRQSRRRATTSTSRSSSALRASLVEPQENPQADLTRRSTSGVLYQDVLDGLQALIPPSALAQRMGVSRTDGYWPYITAGEEPPVQLTYGEFDFFFFADLLDKYNYHQGGGQQQSSCEDKVFVDMGSGAGRLVFAAAALHPGMRQCRGIELLAGLHAAAEDNLVRCRTSLPEAAASMYSLPVPGGVNDILRQPLQLAPLSFTCGSFDDPGVFFGDADCIFVTASCLPTELLQSLHDGILRQCRAGTIVMSTDYPLPLDDSQHATLRMEIVDKVEGWSWVTGGGSTAYIHKVVEK